MTRFTYIYDTYCGWCYGAAPVLQALAGQGAEIAVLHRHLFQGANAHRMADGFGRAAMEYDRRIAALSGQEFSAAYVDNVLKSPTEVLESGLTAAAAALVHDRGAGVELELSRKLQQGRFVDGRSAADASHIEATLEQMGVTQPLSEGLARAAEVSAEATRLMARHHIGGVPALLRHSGERTEVIDVSAYFRAPERIAEIAA